MSGELSLIATVTLPGVEQSVRYARRFLVDMLVPGHLAPGDEVLYDMELVVDEVVGNCIRHTESGNGGKVTIALLKGRGVIRPEVTDDGASGERPHLTADPDGESGRGLHIVNALTACWGYRESGVRTTVWAEFPG